MVEFGRLSDEEIRAKIGEHLEICSKNGTTDLLIEILRELDTRLTPQIMDRMEAQRVNKFLGLSKTRSIPSHLGLDTDGATKYDVGVDSGDGVARKVPSSNPNIEIEETGSDPTIAPVLLIPSWVAAYLDTHIENDAVKVEARDLVLMVDRYMDAKHKNQCFQLLCMIACMADCGHRILDRRRATDEHTQFVG